MAPLAREAGYEVGRLKDEASFVQSGWFGGWALQLNEHVLRADVVIADLTGNSASVAFEVGAVMATGIPTICVSADSVDEASTWLQQHNIMNLSTDRERIVGILREIATRPNLRKSYTRMQELAVGLHQSELRSSWTDDVLASAMKRALDRVQQITSGRRMIRNRNPRLRAREVFSRAIDIMEHGDSYHTITRPAFWKLLGDEFRDHNQRAANVRGIKIERVWPLWSALRHDEGFLRGVRRHVLTEEACGGRIRNVVLPVTNEAEVNKIPHFALLARGGSLDSAYDVMVLQPDYGPYGYMREASDSHSESMEDGAMKDLRIIDLHIAHDFTSETHVNGFVESYRSHFKRASSMSLGEWVRGDPEE